MGSELRLALFAFAALGCAAAPRRFPLAEPMWTDTDTRPVSVPCRSAPTPKEPTHVTCAPEPHVTALAWDGMDKSIFRPLSKLFAAEAILEAPNVNSVDEVPDSAWFTNKLGRRDVGLEELARSACTPAQIIDAANVADGAWLIDKGKASGSTPGFRVSIPGKGKFMFKTDSGEIERPTAASVISAAAYNAAGFNISCEQIVYVRKSMFKLAPGLETTDNYGRTRPFDEQALARVFESTSKRGDLVRFQASAWVGGHILGAFRYEGTRKDDPNDVIPHEDRRDLRGSRLLAAWLDHTDAREQNTLDAWLATNEKIPDSSPGWVRHYFLDTSDTLGSGFAWDIAARRLGHAYLLDWRYLGEDFVTLGIPRRPWDDAARTPGFESFGYFSTRDFTPDTWVAEYPNPTFSRMSERDGAWMARILARFTPEKIKALAALGDFTSPAYTRFVEDVLEARLAKILERYLTRLSPIADVRVEGDRVCGVDLARRRNLRPASAFRFTAEMRGGVLAVATSGDALCVTVPHVAADGGAVDDAPSRYVVVKISDGVAKGSLYVHLYDLGPARGFHLAGIERWE